MESITCVWILLDYWTSVGLIMWGIASRGPCTAISRHSSRSTSMWRESRRSFRTSECPSVTVAVNINTGHFSDDCTEQKTD